MMAESKLKQLSAKEKAALMKELKEELAAAEREKSDSRKKYKDRVNKKVPSLFTTLKKASDMLSVAKRKVYEELADLVNEKGAVYDRKQDQGSHTFTTDEGVSITIGYRMNDGWDDTVDVGIQKVTDYIQSLGKDANSKKLVKTILQLLAKDKTGNLKASRVLQLKKLADDIGDAHFKDAIQIIHDAYRPAKSKQFVTARFVDAQTGVWNDLPLSISDASI